MIRICNLSGQITLEDNDVPIREGDYVMFDSDATYSNEDGTHYDTVKALGLIGYDTDLCRFFILHFDTDDWVSGDVFHCSEIEVIGNVKTHKHYLNENEYWHGLKKKECIKELEGEK